MTAAEQIEFRREKRQVMKVKELLGELGYVVSQLQRVGHKRSFKPYAKPDGERWYALPEVLNLRWDDTLVNPSGYHPERDRICTRLRAESPGQAFSI